MTFARRPRSVPSTACPATGGVVALGAPFQSVFHPFSDGSSWCTTPALAFGQCQWFIEARGHQTMLYYSCTSERTDPISPIRNRHRSQPCAGLWTEPCAPKNAAPSHWATLRLSAAKQTGGLRCSQPPFGGVGRTEACIWKKMDSKWEMFGSRVIRSEPSDRKVAQ
jgi:hypothetical protein